MLNPTLTGRLLDVASLALVAGVAGVGWWAIAPLDPATGESGTRGGSALPAGQTAAVDTMEMDPAIVSRSLRGPLVDPPPKRPVARRPPPVAPKPRPKPTPKKPSIKLTLVGTVMGETGHAAIVGNESGEFDVKGVGETLDLQPAGVTIKQIESDHVTLDYQGAEIRIEVDKTIPAGNPPGRRGRR